MTFSELDAIISQVSFGSLIGILPYRNLAAKWKFLAFESWLRRKGLDPSMYKQNLGIIESYDVQNKTSLDSSLDPEIEKKIDGEISPDMKLENLLRIYDQEKLKFLSSFVDQVWNDKFHVSIFAIFYVEYWTLCSQKIKVFVVMADKKSRKLIFSMRPKENEELVVKKRSLMVRSYIQLQYFLDYFRLSFCFVYSWSAWKQLSYFGSNNYVLFLHYDI